MTRGPVDDPGPLVLGALRPARAILLGFAAAVLAVVIAEGVPAAAGAPGSGASAWSAAALLLLGAAGLAHSQWPAREALQRDRGFLFAAAVLNTPGLLVGDVPTPLVALPGLLAPLWAVARDHSPAARAWSVALAGLAAFSLQSAEVWFGAHYAAVWLVLLALGGVVALRLPAGSLSRRAGVPVALLFGLVLTVL